VATDIHLDHREPFLQSISGRAYLLEFDHLWTDCTHEETRLIAIGVQDSHHDESQALTSNAKRGRINRRSFNKAFKTRKIQQLQVMNREDTYQGFNVLDVKSMDTLQEIVLLGRKEDKLHPHHRNEYIKDEAFFFIPTLSGTIPTDSDIWLIVSGASRHMIGYKEHLIDLVEKESHMHVVLGDNARYIVNRVGTSTFQLDSDILFS
jgi:hypothetical protein